MKAPIPEPDWQIHSEAEGFYLGQIAAALTQCPAAQTFADTLHRLCAIRIGDIVQHVAFAGEALTADLGRYGWLRGDDGVFRHPGSRLPNFVQNSDFGIDISLRCESVRTFLTLNSTEPLASRLADPNPASGQAFTAPGVVFRAVDMDRPVGDLTQPDHDAVLTHQEAFRSRRRCPPSLSDGFAELAEIVGAARRDLGQTAACAAFLASEREFWMSRCETGRLVKSWQDAAGVGWCNIDHYTYDVSRRWFAETIAVFESLGFVRREVFYAGAHAGWGSQILEQPDLGAVIFADLDLTPEELDMDLASAALEPLPVHRRAGLWCGIHGESLFDGGLNHVAGLYDQAKLRRLLSDAGVEMMPPFSDFPHLYQELTYGNRWPVSVHRILELVRGGHISQAESEDFLRNGVIATHFENVERNGGFKGFNQPGIDDVLRVLDPRANVIDMPVPAQ